MCRAGSKRGAKTAHGSGAVIRHSIGLTQGWQDSHSCGAAYCVCLADAPRSHVCAAGLGLELWLCLELREGEGQGSHKLWHQLRKKRKRWTQRSCRSRRSEATASAAAAARLVEQQKLGIISSTRTQLHRLHQRDADYSRSRHFEQCEDAATRAWTSTTKLLGDQVLHGQEQLVQGWPLLPSEVPWQFLCVQC